MIFIEDRKVFFTVDSTFFVSGQARGRTANTWVEGRVQGGKQQVSDENAMKEEQDVKKQQQGCLGVKLSVKLQLGASSVKGLWAKRLLWFPYQIDYVWIKQIKSKYQRNRFLIPSLK